MTAKLTELSFAQPNGPSVHEAEIHELKRVNQRMRRLVAAVQELSLARDLDSITAVTRKAARELTGADGATFVLRDGDQCFYADEDAIAPLWKGQRFPMGSCVSGWVMEHRQSVVIEDIYSDSRIPIDAYRPTFVKSLAMVPIRPESPIGAIGNYWATRRQPTTEELELLQALANTTAVAIENVNVYNELEKRVQNRTAQLAAANQELESFAYAVSHDLGAPLRAIRGYSELLLKECSTQLNDRGKDYAGKVLTGTRQMRELMDDLLRLSRVTQTEMSIQPVNLSELVRDVLRALASQDPERKVETRIADNVEVEADPGLMRIALENLLSNAWKFTGRKTDARIEFGVLNSQGVREYFVRDNGAGFEFQYATKLFQPFRRFHRQEDFSGSGIGLSTVQRVVSRHGGSIRAEAEPDKGATFYFTLGT